MITKLLHWLKYVSLLCIVITGLWLRLWHLDVVPAAFYHDELDYIITGESILKWGTDLSGTWTPWHLKPLQTINMTAELPAVFHALIQLIFGSTPGSARLTNAIFGLATVIIVGLFTAKISDNKKAGYWSSLLLLVNPWHIHISRLAYESTISLFFQVILLHGLVRILPFPSTSNRIVQFRNQTLWLIITLLSLFFGYYTYHGAKFTIPVTVLTYLAWWLFSTLKRASLTKTSFATKVSAGIVFITLCIFLGQSILTNAHGGFGWRSSQDIYSLQTTQNIVDHDRRDRIPFITDKAVLNKYTVALTELVKRYWFTFDSYRLLVTGAEGTYQFSLLVSGYFGILELIGILLFLHYHPNRTYYPFLVSLLLVSPIATVLAGYQALLRSALTYTLLIIFAGWGLTVGLEQLHKHIHLDSLQGMELIIMFWMGASGIWFGLNYFPKYPLLTAENHLLSDRIVARFVRSTQQPLTIVVTTDSYITARSLVYYNQWLSKLTNQERHQFAFPFPATFKLGLVTVTTECPKSLPTTPLVISPSKWQTCGLSQQFAALPENQKKITTLPSPLDNGDYYLIWQNYLCGSNTGRDFIHLSQLTDLNLEQMSDTNFCNTWLKHE